MKRVFYGTVLFSFLLTGSGLGADFSVLLNDDSVQGRFDFAFDQKQYGESIAGLRLLYNDDKETWLGTVSGGVRGQLGAVPGADVGARVLVNGGSSFNDRDLLAIGLGLQASYQPPPLRGAGIYARAQYAPELLSFLDSEDLFEWAIGLDYMITPKATITLEYQKVEVDFENTGERDIDDSVRAGIIFHF